MAQINILGTVVDFPNSGSSPNWSGAIIQFAELVQNALLLAVGPFDIPPQTQNIDDFNAAVDIPITNLLFDSSVVRSAEVVITTHRTNTIRLDSPFTPIEVDETRNITIVYNGTNTSGNKWEITEERNGDASINFAISDTGQMSFTTESIGTGTHLGVLSFSAKSLEQT